MNQPRVDSESFAYACLSCFLAHQSVLLTCLTVILHSLLLCTAAAGHWRVCCMHVCQHTYPWSCCPSSRVMQSMCVFLSSVHPISSIHAYTIHPHPSIHTSHTSIHTHIHTCIHIHIHIHTHIHTHAHTLTLTDTHAHTTHHTHASFMSLSLIFLTFSLSVSAWHCMHAYVSMSYQTVFMVYR